jgi:ABC-type lipoprotein export system ATPase subunit
LAVLGKSGSGQSTLLNLLGGLDTPTSGILRVAGYHLGTLSRRELAGFRQTCVGFVFQSFHLIPWQTVAANIEVPLVLAGEKPQLRKAKVAKVLDAVGLTSRAHARPAELSGGERQRAAVARALVLQPKVLLADEPTGNLDSTTAQTVMDLMLTEVRSRGTTLVIVTHDQELALRSSDRRITMRDGRLLDVAG